MAPSVPARVMEAASSVSSVTPSSDAELAEGLPGRLAGQPGGLQRLPDLGERGPLPGGGGVGERGLDPGAAGGRDHDQVQERGQRVPGARAAGGGLLPDGQRGGGEPGDREHDRAADR